MKLGKAFLEMGRVISILLLSACVETIDFNIPLADSQTVVEGMITTNPGPYTVKVSKALNLNAKSTDRAPIENARIKLYDNQGNMEDFVETSPGIYETGCVMQGVVGRAYHIAIETADGKIFESDPDLLNPVGEIDSIRYEFEARVVEDQYLEEAPANVFNIYIDADAGSQEGNLIRWQFTGTFKIITNPELNLIWLQGGGPNMVSFPDPLPCSGYVRVFNQGVPEIKKVGESTCSTCWVKQFETAPQLGDGQFISAGKYNNIKIAEVPINPATFHEKYLIEVEQMSLTRAAFDFFELVREQKEGASSLFQPSNAEIKGNVKAVNTNESVVGLFWATSIKKKELFIYRDDVPYPLVPIESSTQECYNLYPNSSTEKPEQWD